MTAEETLAATVRETVGVLLYEDDDVEARGAAHAADAALRSLVALVVSERASAEQSRIDAERQRERADKLEQSLLEHIDESVNWQERTERAEKALRRASKDMGDAIESLRIGAGKVRRPDTAKEQLDRGRSRIYATLSGSDEQKPGLADDIERPESREGMVTVYDSDGRYIGCMGRETWEAQLQGRAGGRHRERECRATSWQLEGHAICRGPLGHDGGHVWEVQ